MMISELIEQLEHEIMENGDRPIYLRDWSEEYEDPCELNTVDGDENRVYLDVT